MKKKLLLRMKLIILILGLCIVQVSASTIVLGQNINLQAKDKSIKEVLTSIENQSNYRFFYNEAYIDLSKVVSLNVNEKSIKAVLDELLYSSKVSYKLLENNLVVIVPISELQQKTITGRVTDKNGMSIPGVSVVVKGTSRAVMTDTDGKYSIVVNNNNVVLRFSSIGYMQAEHSVDNLTVINMVLMDDVKNLNEVVVIGYGSVKKSDVTTSISSINSKDVMKTPIITAEEALQGNAAGVLVVNTSGEPGADISIHIRGSSSILADNQPLLVIDGFATDQGLSSINPSDIKSIEVLKDAGATAIYGSRGANGVVLVTTKSGEIGVPRVSFQSYYGFQKLRRKLPLLNGRQLTELSNDARVAVGKAPSSYRLDSILTSLDWQDVMFRIAPQISNTVTVSGGDNKVRYYVSANQLNQEGIVFNSNFSRISLRSNIDFIFSPRFKAGVNLNLSQAIKSGISQGDNGSIMGALKANPGQGAAVDPSGAYYLDPDTGDPSTISPLAKAYLTLGKNKTNSLQGGAYFQWTIGSLILKSTGTYNPTNQLTTYYLPNTIKGSKVSDAREQSTQTFKWSNSNTALFSKTILKHSFTVLAGQEMTNSFSNFFSAENTDFNTDVFTFYSLQSGNGMPATTSSASEYTQLSYFGRATYNFKQRYLLALTYRADGSSKFGADNKWGYFPAASFAWRASEEPFIKKMGVENLKLRMDYGVTGSDRISPYSSLSNYSSTFAAIGGVQKTGFMINKIANPDLKWETTAESDFGVDMSLLKGRISFSVDYYIKNTSNLLMNKGLPAASGYTTVTNNIGSIQNKGWDFELTTNNITGKFTWTTTFNAGFNQNKVTDLGGPTQISAISNSSSGTKFGDVSLIKVGAPIGEFWGYKTDGIFQTWQEVNSTPAKMEAPGVTQPGFPKYVDMNHDGVLNDLDKVPLGNPQPKWNGGLTNTFSYKNFDLSIFITWQYGNSILNNNLNLLEDLRGSNNQLAIVLDRWRAPNPITGDPGNPSNSIPVAFSNGYTAAMSDAYIEDGSYLRVRTISLAYNIPNKIIQRLKITGIKFYVTGTNLLTLTKYYGGFDPEISIMGINSVGAGIDNGGYPRSKMYVFGVNVNF